MSKVFKLIGRFSEDIDLAIIKEPGQTDNSSGRIIKSVNDELIAGFTEVVTTNTTKYKNFRRTEYDYEHLFESGSSGISIINRNLVLEINSLADPVPNERHQVRSIIAEFLEEVNNGSAIDTYGLNEFELNVLNPRPTLIEKILSIIRLSYFDDRADRIRSKVRHFYDIYYLANSDFCKEYVTTADFVRDFIIMYVHDKSKFSDPESWISTDYKESPAFNSFDEIWSSVRTSYETDLRLLVYGEFPSEGKVAEKFRELISILMR